MYIYSCKKNRYALFLIENTLCFLYDKKADTSNFLLQKAKERCTMKLSELTSYNPITVQCHDNPDPDTLASGFGVYCYFKALGKDVRLIYSGMRQIRKANLLLMIEHLQIPVEYVSSPKDNPVKLDGLLITVDCQYGEGNVTRLLADEVAVIDHHQDYVPDRKLKNIASTLGSCATLVWKLLCAEQFDFSAYPTLETSLYYGLYTDTNQFSEISNPLDLNMRNQIHYDKALITLFRNSNISLKELEIAGISLIRTTYNEDYEFAVIQSQPCDPNVLGLISDFLLQVAEVKSCVVFNELEGSGDIKLSVRSCIKTVTANELVKFLTDKIGDGGGHLEKAGGTISRRLFEEHYPTTHSSAYMNNRMIAYFDSYDILDASETEPNLTGTAMYQKEHLPYGYIIPTDFLAADTPISFRTSDGLLEQIVTPELVLILHSNGLIHPTTLSHFKHTYEITEEPFFPDSEVTECLLKNTFNDQTTDLIPLARICIPDEDSLIYARKLTRKLKLFPLWDPGKYTVGNPGDYLGLLASNPKDAFIIRAESFEKEYTAVMN